MITPVRYIRDMFFLYIIRILSRFYLVPKRNSSHSVTLQYIDSFSADKYNGRDRLKIRMAVHNESISPQTFGQFTWSIRAQDRRNMTFQGPIGWIDVNGEAIKPIY